MQQLAGTKYSIVRQIGAGGMGVVYQVVKAPNIGGVLKLMSKELTQHEELKVRFFDEVRILAQLDHPNIVKVFDYDQLPDGTPYYVMELLNGRTVRDVLGTVERVPPRVAYEITRQLLEALHAAHTHEIPVIHRDIKPDNIFLHAPRHGEPTVKLIDFGVSSVGDRKHDDTFVGTWSYAAPEQIRGERPTPATDLYAVGLVLYEMLAGQGPFDHYPDWKLLSIAQLEEIPAPVSKFAPWVPESIVQLIAAALSKDPKLRPKDAHAFAERLYELEWAKGPNSPSVETTSGHAPLSRVLTQVQNARGEAPVIGADYVPTTSRASALRSSDTFASQHSDPRPAPRSRTGYYVLALMLLLGGFAVAATIMLGVRTPPPPTPTVNAALPPPPVPSEIPSAAPPPSTTAPAVSVVAPKPAPHPEPPAAPKPPGTTTGRTDFAREL